MDTEKLIQLEKKIATGALPSDQGPYYHHAWWESYKGSVKGKFGGLVIGAAVGIIAGVAAGAALAVFTAATAAVAIPVTAIAFAGAGMVYGAHEFGDIGKSVGNTAAQFYQHELREKAILKAETAEIKEELNNIKALIKGETPKSDPKNIAAINAAREQEGDYRKTHYAKLVPPKINSFAFWKVALIGLAVGAAVGALLATSGLASPIIAHALGEAAVIELGKAGVMALSIGAFSAMGASFGISRDFFRKVFDKTDLWFDGVVNSRAHDRVREHQELAGIDVQEQVNGKGNDVATAVIPSGGIDYPKSETHFRDKVLPAAQRALLSFDHTRATPQ